MMDKFDNKMTDANYEPLFNKRTCRPMKGSREQNGDEVMKC